MEEQTTLKPNEYQCAQCDGIFELGWTEEEAKEEMLKNFGTTDTSGMAMICDDCYKKMFPSKWN